MKCTIAMMFALYGLANSAHGALLGHWKFNEASGVTTAADSAGSTTGTVGSGVITGVPGIAGNAYQFPGHPTTSAPPQSAVVDFGNAPAVIPSILATDKITISAWFNWTFNHFSRGTAVSFAMNTNNQNFIDLGVTGSGPSDATPPVTTKFNTKGGVYGGINISGTKDEVVNTTGFNDGGSLVNPAVIPLNTGTALDNGQWHHVVMTIDASTDIVELFVDGVSKGTNPAPPIVDEFEFSGTWDNFEVGRLGRLAPAAPYNGKVDDIQVYDEILSASQVSFLFNNPGTATPEPASLALLGLGLSGLALLGRQCRT